MAARWKSYQRVPYNQGRYHVNLDAVTTFRKRTHKDDGDLTGIVYWAIGNASAFAIDVSEEQFLKDLKDE